MKRSTIVPRHHPALRRRRATPRQLSQRPIDPALVTHEQRKARLTKDLDAADIREAFTLPPPQVVEPLRETYTCGSCAGPIDIRYPTFTICTACAMRINSEQVAPWREEQRQIARARIAALKLKQQQEGDDHVL